MNLNINLGPEKTPKEPSSIDRFFWAKSTKLFSGSFNNFGLGAWILSGALSIATVLFLILAIAAKGFPLLFPILFGSLSVIAIALAVGFEVRSRRNPLQVEVKVSSSGRKLLQRIGGHIGWYDPNGAGGNNQGWNNWWQSVFGTKTASDILRKESGPLLEAGCSQYNRLAGLLKLAKDSQGRSSNMAPQIQAAADEAMISLINQVGLLEDNPESKNAIVSQCSGQITKLKELADRFEELLSGPTTLADRLASTTVMDNVLDQLRMEAQAHEELRFLDQESR